MFASSVCPFVWFADQEASRWAAQSNIALLDVQNDLVTHQAYQLCERFVVNLHSEANKRSLESGQFDPNLRSIEAGDTIVRLFKAGEITLSSFTVQPLYTLEPDKYQHKEYFVKTEVDSVPYGKGLTLFLLRDLLLCDFLRPLWKAGHVRALQSEAQRISDIHQFGWETCKHQDLLSWCYHTPSQRDLKVIDDEISRYREQGEKQGREALRAKFDGLRIEAKQQQQKPRAKPKKVRTGDKKTSTERKTKTKAPKQRSRPTSTTSTTGTKVVCADPSSRQLTIRSYFET